MAEWWQRAESAGTCPCGQGYRVWTSLMLNQEHIVNETIALVAFGGYESRSKTSMRPVRFICDSPAPVVGTHRIREAIWQL